MIPDDGSWSNTLRSLFVYGTGGARFWVNLSRSGTPTQIFVIIGSTLMAYGLSRAIQNVINDPNYVLANVTNWRTIWNDDNSATVFVDHATEQRLLRTSNSGSVNTVISGNGEASSEVSKSLKGGNFDIGKFSESIVNQMAEYLDNIFEPVQLSFSNEVLSHQIKNLSIYLWILTVCLSIFFLSLLFNIALFVFSDKLSKYFTNKYILLYLSFNKKVIGFEIIMLSGWIVYLLYILLTGLHYIPIHPIIFPV